MGMTIIVVSALVLVVRFPPETERAEKHAIDLALADRAGLASSAAD